MDALNLYINSPPKQSQSFAATTKAINCRDDIPMIITLFIGQRVFCNHRNFPH